MTASDDTADRPRVLLLAAHPHDEFAIAATLRAHARAGDEVWAAFLAHDDRPEIDVLRRHEAERAAVGIGIPPDHLVFAALEAVALPLQLPELVAAVRELVERIGPERVYCPAFEGGHPDHDAVSFAAYEAAILGVGVECYEYPIYRKAESRRMWPMIPRFARLLPGTGEPHVRHLDRREQRFKHSLWKVYQSQRPVFDLLLRFSGDETRFFSEEETRPLPMRSYETPPHEGPLLYEENSSIWFDFEEFKSMVRRYHWSGGVSDRDAL